MENNTHFYFDGGHYDGTGHRKMAVLGMASYYGDNPWKFRNNVIV